VQKWEGTSDARAAPSGAIGAIGRSPTENATFWRPNLHIRSVWQKDFLFLAASLWGLT